MAMYSLEIAKDLHMKRFINGIGVGHQETTKDLNDDRHGGKCCDGIGH